MTATPTTTASSLAQALTKAGLQDYAGAFADQGYESLSDLGTDEADARTAITAVVPEGKPGIVNRIVALWKAANPPSRPTPDAQPIPDLPPGTTVDLSQPTVQIEGVEYTIPSSLATTRDTEDYGPADWMVVAKRTKILYGVNLDLALQTAVEDGARAPRAALVWSVPDGDDYLDGEKRSLVTSTLSYTSSSGNLVRSRIMDASVSIGAPFVSVAAQASREERQASGQEHRRLFMTGMWRYQQATLKLQECTAASPAFVKEISAAVALPEDQRFDGLRKVFDRYGHAVPRSVTLGGQLYFISERNTVGKVSEDSVKNTISAAVSAKFGGIGGGASASFSDGEGKSVASQDIAESVSFTCVGGDTTLGSNPSEWAGTAKNPNAWAIIGRSGLVPVVEWLPADLKAKVQQTWQNGLKKAWGGYPAPDGYANPDFNGQPFTVTALPPEQRWGSRFVPSLRSARNPQFPDGAYLAGIDSALLADPAAHDLGWQLIYTGKTTQGGGRGKPMYWLANHSSAGSPSWVAASAVHPERTPNNGLPTYYAVLLPATEMTTNARTPETSAATWTVAPIDPGGYYGSKYDQAFVLTNVKTNRALGPLLWNDSGALVHPAGAPRSWFGVDGDPSNAPDTCVFACVNI